MNWQVRLALTWRRLRKWLRILSVVLAALIAVTLTPGVALADHNSAHDCPTAIANAVLAGKMGGNYWAVGDRVTWTNAVYVCVFQGGAAKTFFKSRNAAKYAAKDAAKHGAKQVAADTAAAIVKSVKTLPMIAVNPSIIDPSCYVTHLGRRYNICQGGIPQ